MVSLEVIINLVVLFLIFSKYEAERGRKLSDEEDMEMERQLAFLNKPPITSFQIKGGIIYDCIDIDKQASLDHPTLKDHKIQMQPSYRWKEISNQTSSVEKASLAMLTSIRCPEGTVPIRRTRKEDLIRLKDFSETHPTSFHQHSTDAPGNHVAILKPSDKNPTYYGVHANINVHNLKVSRDQYTTAQMWIESGPPNERTSLQAGWMVAPQISGDDDTHIFVYWTNDNFKTGCFNLLCPGFIQVHPGPGPASSIHPTSIYGGKQYVIELAILQDNNTGNWWLELNGESIGYWPKSLLPQLNRGASFVAWGGFAMGPPNGDSPPMGNGHFPDGIFKEACFIHTLRTIDASYRSVMPDENGLKKYVDNNKCYDVQFIGNFQEMELAFLFGGPGGKCGI